MSRKRSHNRIPKKWCSSVMHPAHPSHEIIVINYSQLLSLWSVCLQIESHIILYWHKNSSRPLLEDYIRYLTDPLPSNNITEKAPNELFIIMWFHQLVVRPLLPRGCAGPSSSHVIINKEAETSCSFLSLSPARWVFSLLALLCVFMSYMFCCFCALRIFEITAELPVLSDIVMQILSCRLITYASGGGEDRVKQKWSEESRWTRRKLIK